jgi:predicted GH43/DUF377 family glycosyl hydrolase
LSTPEQGGPRAPFSWSAAAEPVIDRGDDVDVLNPSVVKYGDGPAHLNFYSLFDGKAWHTALAISIFGEPWKKRGRVLSPQGWEGSYIAANGSALVAGLDILYWYQAGDPVSIGLARSSGKLDKLSRHRGPVLRPGPRGSFDERGVADPYVIRTGEWFVMFYLGVDRAGRQQLGMARSTDGVRWEKLRTNPILEIGAAGAFDENGLGEPAVWSSGGSYWMLYTGRDRGERRRIGLARSADGVNWSRELGFAPIAGDQPWNREVMCDPSVEVTPDGVRVWFGGGNVAHPAERINGMIGVGFLRSGLR